MGRVHIVQTANVCAVFAISGLLLRTEEIKKALGHWVALLWGTVAILFLTGLLGFALRAVPLSPPEFAIGEPPPPGGGASGRRLPGWPEGMCSGLPGTI